jgi:hypothetical protein
MAIDSQVFAPGCALLIYKPHLAEAVLAFLDRELGGVDGHMTCCRHEPVCCGDSFFGELPDARVRELMTRRADSMPAQDVVVYCVSCVKAMCIGGKRPRYLVDLLFAETTECDAVDLAEWHAELDRFIAEH